MINNFLFNFSSSYKDGGLKRIMAYVQWFNRHGGAYFIVNIRMQKLLCGYENNHYYYINPQKIEKALNRQNYLKKILNQLPFQPDLYYSYGIPIHSKIGKINWYHLSNVLPFISHSEYGLSLLRSIELKWLGYLTRKGYKNTEVLSAESNYSLSLLPSSSKFSHVFSPNGSDEEIKLFSQSIEYKVNNIAVIVGTVFYKDLDSSYNIFLRLQTKNSKLRLVVVGNDAMVPDKIKNDQRVDMMGELKHSEVVSLLSSARFYINTSKVENSWNAISEGIFLATESYISNIPPHLELIKIIQADNYELNNGLIHIKKSNIVIDNLDLWSDIIKDMIKASTIGDNVYK